MNNNKKVTVITLQNVRNYGSALQALATQAVFKSLGCEVDFINYFRPDHISLSARIKKWCEGMGAVKKMVYASLLYPSFARQDRVFEDFIRRYLNVAPGKYSSREDFKTYPITSDIYCTGSDQTWNSGWNGGIIGSLFLDFVPDNVRKIAYAASFGKQRLEEWEKDETKRLIDRYAAISVRESSGVEICDDLGYNGAVHVLDPTLQVGGDYWRGIVGGRRVSKEPYVLIYQLNSNADFDRYAKEYAKRKGLKLVRFCWRYDQMVKCGKPLAIPPVEDFATAIMHADTVITDSFHATAFSINLNTDFISIYPHEYGGRIGSILQLTRLENRHLKSYDDFSYVDAPRVDFTEANRILDAEREKGLEFLREAVK